MIDLKRHLKSLSSPFIVKHFPLQPAFLGVKSSGDSSFQQPDFESFLRPSIAHSSQLRSLHLLAPTVPVFCFLFENLLGHDRRSLFPRLLWGCRPAAAPEKHVFDPRLHPGSPLTSWPLYLEAEKGNYLSRGVNINLVHWQNGGWDCTLPLTMVLSRERVNRLPTL